MDNTSYIALSRQMALQRRLDIRANNLANMNTTGFKGERILFNEHIDRVRFNDRLRQVTDIASAHDMQAGPLSTTDRDLDVAIKGEGFMVVRTPLGDRYTRNGRLSLDADRRLVTVAGDPILTGQDQEITIPDGTRLIEFKGDGSVVADGNEVGQINLVTFDNLYDMKKVAGSMFRTDQPPLPAEEAALVQGMIERSNVEPIRETVDLIEIQKSFTQTQNFIERENQRIQAALRVLGKPSN